MLFLVVMIQIHAISHVHIEKIHFRYIKVIYPVVGNVPALFEGIVPNLNQLWDYAWSHRPESVVYMVGICSSIQANDTRSTSPMETKEYRFRGGVGIEISFQSPEKRA